MKRGLIWAAAAAVALVVIVAAFFAVRDDDVRPYGYVVPADKEARWIQLAAWTPRENCKAFRLVASASEQPTYGAVVVRAHFETATLSTCDQVLRGSQLRFARVELNSPIGERAVFGPGTGPDQRIAYLGKVERFGEQLPTLREAEADLD